MPTEYVIQFTTDSDKCLGVSQANAGAPVVLSLLQSPISKLTKWHLDPNSGAITLAGSNPPLYLDFQGTSPSNGVPIIISNYVLGRASQIWNWLGNPPYIMNVGAPNYCVDDSNGGTQPGTKIQIWSQMAGNTNQQWQLLAVPVLEEALAASSR